MKSWILGAASLLAFPAGAAQAQVAYTNSVLNGCYADFSTSVDTGSTVVGRDGVGTICFDGKGNIVGTSKVPALSGGVSNTDGVAHANEDHTGTYKVTNSPGDGMGTFEGRCTVHAFVLRRVDSEGLAHGFNYILTKRKKGCKDNGPLVDGGSAEYQGPLK